MLKNRLHSCCKQRKKDEEHRSPESVVNIGIEYHFVSSLVENDLFDSAETTRTVGKKTKEQLK